MRESYRRHIFGSLLLIGATLVATAASTLMPESAILWDAKNAYLKCDGAIDGSIAWPSTPASACVAMLMCANERALSTERHQRLIETDPASTRLRRAVGKRDGATGIRELDQERRGPARISDGVAPKCRRNVRLK